MKCIVRACTVAFALAGVARAQTGSVTGTVSDNTRKPLPGVVVQVVGTRLGGYVGQDGAYRIDNVPAGSQRLLARFPGFSADTVSVTVTSGQSVAQDLVLRASAAVLTQVNITRSPRLNESVAAARDEQKNASNIVDVLSGDEIRALPALNAAEASERIPGVTTERDEGEGKFVQVRGLEPTLQNVTVDGVHIPGTLSGDRSVKLDNVPADIIGAIEISKTLTADMDADAIGGSINIRSKVPEGEPHGYISGQYGITSPALFNASSDNFAAGQGSIFYGGRLGKERKFGFLLGGSVDRNDRPISDLEPSWSPTTYPTNAAQGAYFPSSFDHRIYRYFRQRFGADIETDYRFDAQNSVFLKGLYSQFLNHGYRYVYNVSANNDGPNDYGVNGNASRNISNRTPNEQLYGLTAGGQHNDAGPFQIDYHADFSGTESSESNYRFSTFVFNQPVTYQYNNSNVVKPMWTVKDPRLAAALVDPNNYLLTHWDASNNKAIGVSLGGALNFRVNYAIGASPSSFRFGVKYRNDQKGYTNTPVTYDAPSGQPLITMAQLNSNISDPNYYHNVFPVNTGSFGSVDRTTAFENAHSSYFINHTDTIGNLGNNYFGREQVSAAYIENELDIGVFHFNAGLRAEHTREGWIGHPLVTDSLGNVSPEKVLVSHTYADLFPSGQIRVSPDENTNLRAAVTRGIARPNYGDLAPNINGTADTPQQQTTPNNSNQSLTSGNTKLKPERAWNYDLLFERFLPRAGVLSGGVFYKDLSDFIYNQRFFNYQGPVKAFFGAGGTQPLNGRHARLWGVEADWSQHLTFLPGALAGLGFDVNWTHVESRTAYQIDSIHVRHGLLPRTSPNIANASLVYDYGRFNIRAAWVYQGYMLASTGGNPSGNGASSASTGDNYFYAHSQIDGSIQYALFSNTTVQLQLLNLNNAAFGFFNGTPAHEFDVQREYYGPTFYFGLRQGF